MKLATRSQEPSSKSLEPGSESRKLVTGTKNQGLKRQRTRKQGVKLVIRSQEPRVKMRLYIVEKSCRSVC